MMSRWRWVLIQTTRRLWVRATLFCVLAVVTAVMGIAAAPFIPADIPGKIGADAVDRILGILAASMLTVTTFSLTTMVSAYTAATNNVTPRATKLLIQDTTTQNTLATFLGSFLYSLVGIIILTTGAYGSSGRVVLFGVTIVVIILIVVHPAALDRSSFTAGPGRRDQPAGGGCGDKGDGGPLAPAPSRRAALARRAGHDPAFQPPSLRARDRLPPACRHACTLPTSPRKTMGRSMSRRSPAPSSSRRAR